MSTQVNKVDLHLSSQGEAHDEREVWRFTTEGKSVISYFGGLKSSSGHQSLEWYLVIENVYIASEPAVLEGCLGM